MLFKDNLKFKHHILLHYCDCIIKSGPVRFLNTFRFEAKHRTFKQYCENINSRKNICWSVSIKLQYMFAFKLIEKNGLQQRYKTKHTTKIYFKDYDKFNNIKRDNLEFKYDEEFELTKEIEFNGKTFKKSFLLTKLKPILSVFQIVDIFFQNGIFL